MNSAEAAAAPAAPSLLRIAAFRAVWGVRVGWTVAIQMTMVAVGWQMYELTRSPWDLALVGLFQFVPALLLTLPAGHAADHWPRGRVMAACLLLQAAVAALLAAGSAADALSRGHLLAASLLLGGARAFQMPALQAAVPGTVPPALLSRAMAASSTGTQVSVIVGPALGGGLIVFGLPVLYAVATALFVVAVVLALRLPRPVAPAAKRGVSMQSLFAGVHFVRRQPVILGAITLDLLAVLFGGAVALLPMFAKEVLHGGPAMLGWLRAAPAIGALAMSLLLVRRPPSRRVGPTLLAAVAVFGAATIVFGLSTSFAVSMAALMVNGAADMVSVVIRLTLVQVETPDEMRGRVSAVNSIFIGAGNQLGEFQAGSVAALLGPVAAVVLGGALTCALAALWPRLFPDLSRRRTLEA